MVGFFVCWKGGRRAGAGLGNLVFKVFSSQVSRVFWILERFSVAVGAR